MTLIYLFINSIFKRRKLKSENCHIISSMANAICLSKDEDVTEKSKTALLLELIETKIKLAKMEEEKSILFKKSEIAEKIKKIETVKQKENGDVEIKYMTRKCVKKIVDWIEDTNNLDLNKHMLKDKVSRRMTQYLEILIQKIRKSEDLFLEQSKETIKELTSKMKTFEDFVSTSHQMVKQQNEQLRYLVQQKNLKEREIDLLKRCNAILAKDRANLLESERLKIETKSKIAAQLKNITKNKEKEYSQKIQNLQSKLLEITKKFIEVNKVLHHYETEREQDETKLKIRKEKAWKIKNKDLQLDEQSRLQCNY